MPENHTPTMVAALRVTKPMDEHWPDPADLKLADKAWDQIEQVLEQLVEDTHCPNEAITDLLAHIGQMFPDAIEELQHRINRKRQEARD